MYSGKKRIMSSLLVSLGVLFSNSCSFAGKKRLSVGGNYVRVKGSRFNRVPKPIPNLRIGDIRKGKYDLRKRSKSNSNVPLYLLGAAGVIAFAGGTYLVCSDSGESPKKIEDKKKGDSGKGGKPATPGKKDDAKKYESKKSDWKLYYRKKISDSGTILRIYHGNIVQIGRDEDIFRSNEVGNEKTIIVSPDNSDLDPGGTLAAEIASAANDRRYSGSYKYPDDTSCREEIEKIKKSGKDWGITGILGKSGGYLQVGNIFHIVAPESTDKDRNEVFKEVYVNCILSGEAGGGRVVIPPLGDGSFGNSTEDTAKFFAEALKEVSGRKDCKMPKYVDLVIHSKFDDAGDGKNKHQVFVDAVSKVFGKSEEIK